MREILGQAAASPDDRPLIMAGVGALVLADDTSALELVTRAVTRAPAVARSTSRTARSSSSWSG